jgi:hypothetical protein
LHEKKIRKIWGKFVMCAGPRKIWGTFALQHGTPTSKIEFNKINNVQTIKVLKGPTAQAT